MCGIAGIVHFDNRPINRDILSSMTAAVSHRGPDAEGIYVDGSVGLGHRRLSIIDLSTGHQPMRNADDSLVITFNGEIYNYIELRTELQRQGIEFVTESDTEVVLKAYQVWGAACQERFNGMWAFAIWDRINQTLFISRDRIGEKPLHYALHDNSLLFGSEIKSLLKYGMTGRIREEMLEIYLTLGYIPSPHTFYKDIHKLRPGYCLIIKHGRVAEHKYWEMPQVDENDMLTDEAAVLEEFTTLLNHSVKLRMRSDVPFGAFLSGGLDSATIVSLMAGHSSYPVETFTIGFDVPEYDERSLARDVSAAYHTNHHEYVVNPDLVEESLRNILYYYDEPFGDSSAMPTSHVCRLAAQHVKMVLTGDGGDEVLSGYPAYQSEKFAASYQKLPQAVQALLPFAATLLAKPFSGNMRYKMNRMARVLTASASEFQDRLISKLAYVQRPTIKSLVAGRTDIWKVEDFIGDILRDCNFKDPFYKLMYFHFMVSLPDRMLTKVDRMSMAYSLEARVPFLDYRIVELMVRVNKNIKMPGYDRKHVLKKTMASGLPESLIKGTKKGFIAPLREWFKRDGFEYELSALVNDGFGLQKDAIADVVSENKAGRRDNGNFIWMLLLLKQWMAGMA